MTVGPCRVVVEAITVVRSVHILFAVLWAGASMHFAFVSKKPMEDQGIHLHFLADSKHGPYMGMTALGTVGFGIATWSMAGGDAYSSTQNMILGMGALAAVVGLLVGFGGHLPNSIRAKKAIAAGDVDACSAISAREVLLDRISMGAVGFALLAMIVFRWF